MQKRTLALLILLLLIAPTTGFAQNDPSWPKTFLWRISGNGLTKDSYLYGSMHLQDKRLFNFGDSLYRYMEKAEGYALEIDLSEFLDSMIQRVIDEKQYYLEDEERLENAKEKRKIIDSLVSNVTKQKDKRSRKILERLRNQKFDAILKKEMPTMMDAFLYGIARRQGKWLGGIEDLQDQLPLLDELGGDVTSEELLSSEKDMTDMMEKMIKIYISKDLNEIESYYLYQNQRLDEDFSLIKRNTKMARRMDSLSHIRSMFFTVGVAHLPGDSGVIKLLRSKGYRLDPVYSTGTVDPLQYVSSLRSVAWQKTSDDNKSFEIEMPGKASEASIASGMVKMNYYVDLSTLTFFMTSSSIVSDNIDLDTLVEMVSKDQNAKVLSKKNIELKGIKGIETHIFVNQNYFKNLYLLRGNRLYMLFVGGQKKETMDGPDADHFLASFTPSKEMPVAQKTWKRFEVSGKGCSILLPGDARKNPRLSQGIRGNWNFSTYDLADPASGSYYIFQVRDLNTAYHISADSNIFITFRSSIENTMKTVTRDEVSTFNGFPAYYYDGEEPNGVVFKSMLVNRGNRCYYMMTEGHNTPASLADMNNFLSSFTLSDYEESNWKKQVQPVANFHSTGPAEFIFIPKDDSTSGDDDIQVHYVSYDSTDCTSYEVFKTKISPYYSISNDTAFFLQMGSNDNIQTDSVLGKRWVTNGNLKGLEWTIQSAGNNNLKRYRHLLNGDTLYTLLSYIPVQYIDQKAYTRFFDDFRVTKEDLSPTIYNSKTKEILTDLLSTDSATFSAASEALRTAKFRLEDKTLLEEALLKEYQDDASSSINARDRIVDSLAAMMDSNTIVFIKSNFSGLTGSREFIKMNLLDLLVRNKTQYSFDVLKELIIKYPPKNTGEYSLNYHITDSLELAKSLFPDLLQLSDNPILAVKLMGIASDMLRNNLIPVSMLEPHMNRFIHTADTLYESLLKQDLISRSYLITEMLNLVQQLNDAEGNRVLKKYLGLENLEIKQSTIEYLLKNNQPVDPKQVEKVAADKSYRIYFYEQLHKMGKTSVFPSAYNTQKSMGEADVYVYSVDEDYEPSEIKSLGAKTIQYKGKSFKIYLFRLMYEGKDDNGNTIKEFYLGISGPFSTNQKDLLTESELTTIFFDEEYDAKKAQQKILDYIKSAEMPEEEEAN